MTAPSVTQRMACNGPRSWSPGLSRPRLVNARRFFRKGPRSWSPGLSRSRLVNAPRFFRNSRRIRLRIRLHHPASSQSGGLLAIRRTRARRSLASKLGPVLFHGFPSCLDCVSYRRFLLQADLLDLDQEIPGLDLRAQKRGRLADHARRFKRVVGNRLGEIVFRFSTAADNRPTAPGSASLRRPAPSCAAPPAPVVGRPAGSTG